MIVMAMVTQEMIVMAVEEMVVPQMVLAIVNRNMMNSKLPLLSWSSSYEPSKNVQIAVMQTEVQVGMADQLAKETVAQLAEVVVAQLVMVIAIMIDRSITTSNFSTQATLQLIKDPT